MPASVRHIKTRIQTIENTKKIMRALEMVSAAKLKRIEDRLDFFQRYSQELNRLLGNLLVNPELAIPSIFKKRDSLKTFVLCVITSDTGLCGSYNHRLLKLADDFVKQYALKAEVQLVIIGKKGLGYFKKTGLPILMTYLNLHGRFSFEVTQTISHELQKIFFNSPETQLFVVYTKFKSFFHMEPTIETLFEFPEPSSAQPPSSFP
jgi:F-type H+-transporting ATPase subunit gamma